MRCVANQRRTPSTLHAGILRPLRIQGQQVLPKHVMRAVIHPFILTVLLLTACAETQYQLASMYWEGKEVDRDRNEALKWYQRAAQHGHQAAQFQNVIRFTLQCSVVFQ